jgi:hypothetical protein
VAVSWSRQRQFRAGDRLKIALNQDYSRSSTSYRRAKSGNPTAGAKVDDRTGYPCVQCRTKQHGFETGPVMPSGRLNRLDTAAEEGIDGAPVG